MNTVDFIKHNDIVFLSYNWLVINSISIEAVKKWKQRYPDQWLTIDGQQYFNYDYIPKESRSKLPEKYQLVYEAEQEKEQKSITWWHNLLNEAIESKEVARYRSEILQLKLPVTIEKVVTFAKKASVFGCINRNYTGRKGELSALHNAYLKLFPDSYSLVNRFRMAITQSQKEGVLSVAIDKRYQSGRIPVFDSRVECLALALLSSGKKYNISLVHRQLSQKCTTQHCQVPSLSWLRNFASQPNISNSIREQREGSGLYQNTLPKATIIAAEYIGDQWQMDGWRLPIYCKSYDKNGKVKYFITYNLFVVMDAHSRKILAAVVTESENTECILTALEQAVRNTGILPFEIVADNHSFNKTDEAGNIKEQFEKIGGHWTVDSNPRRKAILERAFKKLGEEHFKTQYGYKGQGIRTRDKNGLTSPELMAEYTTPNAFLDKKQLCVIVSYVIEQYNNTTIKKLDATPTQRYEKSDMPNAFKVDPIKQVMLFSRKGTYKVTSGQITIERAGQRHEYVLPSKYIHLFNGQKVTACYENFDEIYVFDTDDNYICNIKPKVKIHGALANQTDEDIENFNKLKGKIEGVKNQAAKTRQKLYEDASLIAPEGSEILSFTNSNKDVIEEVKHNANMCKWLADMDVNILTVTPINYVNEVKEKKFKPVDKSRSPCYKKGSMRVLNLEEEALK